MVAAQWHHDETIRDTHSLYLQTLGEFGIIGFALIAAFLAVLLRRRAAALRAGPADRTARRGAGRSRRLLSDRRCGLDVADTGPRVVLLLLASLLVTPRLAAAETRPTQRHWAQPFAVGLRRCRRCLRSWPSRSRLRRRRCFGKAKRTPGRRPPGGSGCSPDGGERPARAPPRQGWRRHSSSRRRAGWRRPRKPRKRPRIASRPTGAPGWCCRASKPSAGMPSHRWRLP